MIKKHGFNIISQVVIIAIVLFSVSLVSPVSVTKKTMKADKGELIDYCIKDVLLLEAEQLDHSYHWATLTNDVPLDATSMSMIQQQLNEEFHHAYNLPLFTDRNFYYRIQVGKEVNDSRWDASITQKKKEQAMLSATIKTDDKGNVLSIQTNSDTTLKLTDDFEYLLPLAMNSISTFVSDEWLNEHQNAQQYVSYQLPKNLEMEVYIPETLKNNQRFLYTTLIDYSTELTKISFFLSVGIGICLLLGFILPLSFEKQAKMFSRFLRFKIEVVAILSAIMFGVGLIGSLIIVSTLDGQVPYFFSYYNISDHLFLIRLGIGILLYCVFVFITFLIGYIKNFFHMGIKAFVKENTYIYQIVHYFCNINVVNFKKTFILKILILCFLHMMLMIFICGLRMDIMFICILIESLLVFIFITHTYQQVMRQYDACVKSTKQLANGHFDIEPIDVPTFEALYDNLVQIKQGFSKALEQGIQSQNVKTELITNVSHDLKTPLTGLKNYVELLQDDKDPQHMEEYIQKVAHYTNRLDHLVVDLFDVSKANAGALTVNLECVDICELIKQVQAEYATQWQDNDLTTVYKMPQTPAMVMIDPNKMVRVFENLIQNINRYAMEHTRVFIEIKEVEDSYQICYKNTSKQPLDFNAEDITERFIRGDKSRHEVGSGLGLAIVKSFTEIQHGTFTISIDGDLFKAILTLPKANNNK